MFVLYVIAAFVSENVLKKNVREFANELNTYVRSFDGN